MNELNRIGCLKTGQTRFDVLDDLLSVHCRSGFQDDNSPRPFTPGFVWQLLNEGGDSTTFHLFDDPEIIVNFTVWESIEALFDFTYKSQHVEFFRRRHEWFEQLEELPSLAMWWIPAGHIPSLKEAEAKILHLRDHGPTSQAFTFKQRFAAP